MLHISHKEEKHLERAMVHGAMHGAVHHMDHSISVHHSGHHHHNGHHSSLEHAVVHGAVVGGLNASIDISLNGNNHHHHNKHHHHHHENGAMVAAEAFATVATMAAMSPVLPIIAAPSIVLPSVISTIVEFIDSSNKIYVTLNQPSYVSGDIVTGTVELDCLVPFYAKGVLLKVKGFERVWWEYQETEWQGEGQNRRQITHTREKKENKEFFRDTIRVYPQHGTVGSGHYSFPFTYQLPSNLPGTYFEEGGHHGNRYYAKVLYKLKATLDVAFRHDLHNTTRLIVNERFDQLVKPSFAENSKSFLTSSGNLHIRTWLDKNAYFPGETVLAKLKANNTSVKPTRKIVIRVVHCLELKAHGHSKRVSNVEYEKQFEGFEPCYYGVKWMPFNIPVGLVKPSSLMGHHVHSSYLFHIECDIPGAIDLSVALPVRILAPQFLWSAAPPQPQGAILPPSVLIRPPWQPDNQAPNCNSCSAKFSIINRRHHCRHCAKVYCGKCCAQKVPIPKLKYKDSVRVCGDCVPHAQQGGKKYQSTKEIMGQWQVSQGMVDGNGASSPMLGSPVMM